MKHYEEALARLKSGKTIIVPKGTTISNDAVSLEAGYGKGSIKKSRPQFADLIAKISEAADEQKKPRDADLLLRLNDEKTASKAYSELYQQALSRELSLVHELFRVKEELAKLTGEKIIPLLRAKDSLET